MHKKHVGCSTDLVFAKRTTPVVACHISNIHLASLNK